MEFSTQDKARIFALYLGCECKFVSTISGISMTGTLLSVCSYTDEILVKITSLDNDMGVMQNTQLLLKPLSDVSDEDMISIAQIILDKGGVPSKDSPLFKFCVNVAKTAIKDIFNVAIKGWQEQLTRYRDYKEMRHAVMIADLLRSRGYAVPCGYIDLFEAGIAINVNDKNK